MKNTENGPSCATSPGGKKKFGLWLALIAVTTTAGALLGNVYSGLFLGMFLGLPLMAGGS